MYVLFTVQRGQSDLIFSPRKHLLTFIGSCIILVLQYDA